MAWMIIVSLLFLWAVLLGLHVAAGLANGLLLLAALVAVANLLAASRTIA
jgi:hypothetical protein